MCGKANLRPFRHKDTVGTEGETVMKKGMNRQPMRAAASLAVACAFWSQAASPPQKGDVRPDAAHVQTATTHPMKYRISLPKGWSADRKWPVLVAPNAHYTEKEGTIELFAPLRDAKKLDFIIVAPFVINADRVGNMNVYRGAVMDSISAADAASPAGGRRPDRNDAARAKFDSEGIVAIIKDVQKTYHGDDKVCMTGFSSSTHIAYMFLFAHPELLKGVIINSGVYLGRGVDESHIPFMNSPERADLDIKYIIGEDDPGYKKCSENWLEAKAKLLSYGHLPSKVQMEVIKKGNPDNLSTGHTWFPTRILDFCAAVELANNR